MVRLAPSTAASAAALSIAALAVGPSAAAAKTIHRAHLVHTPSVRIEGTNLTAIARFDRKLTQSTSGALAAAKHLRQGANIAPSYGYAEEPAQRGTASRHCYVVDIQQKGVRSGPHSTRPKYHVHHRAAHWRVAVEGGEAIGPRSQIAGPTRSISLKLPKPGWQQRALKRLHCGNDAGAGPSRLSRKELLHHNAHVAVDEMTVNKRPSKVYIGVLKRGELFHVIRFSPSGKYARGYAQQHHHSPRGWVLTSDLG